MQKLCFAVEGKEMVSAPESLLLKTRDGYMQKGGDVQTASKHTRVEQ